MYDEYKDLWGGIWFNFRDYSCRYTYIFRDLLYEITVGRFWEIPTARYQLIFLGVMNAKITVARDHR